MMSDDLAAPSGVAKSGGFGSVAQDGAIGNLGSRMEREQQEQMI